MPINNRIHESSTYVTGAALDKTAIYIVAKDKGLTAEDINHARFVAFIDGQLYHSGDKNWNCVACCFAQVPERKFVAISEEGQVFTYAKGVAGEEAISGAKVLRAMCVVEGLPYACGMQRQVYKRTDNAVWEAMHAPVGTEAGFEAIQGYSANEIYAAGWKGEVWEYDGSTWHARGSLVETILTGISCAEDAVYICGQNGVLLKGKHDKWEKLDLDVHEDFWDVHTFNGVTYVATLQTLYMLKDNTLAPVDFGAEKPNSCGKLTSAGGTLWSIGEGTVFSFDGTTWELQD